METIAEPPMIAVELSQTDSGASQIKAKPWLFSGSKASEMARLSHVRRKERAAELAANPPPLPQSQPETQPAIDSPAVKLARVQDELIERMTGNDDPKAVSALAQALKNVREVYHLVTGQAKPGTLQPSKAGRSRQPVAQSLPEPDDTPQPVVSTPNPQPDVTDTAV